MAARTLLMDIRRQQWSPGLCELFGIPLSMLPENQTFRRIESAAE